MKFFRTGLVVLTMLGLGLIVRATPVYAVACDSSGTISAGSDFTCTYSHSNTVQLDELGTVTVQWTASTQTFVISFSGSGPGGSLPAGITFAGFDSFAFNSTTQNVTTFPGTWTANGGTCGATGQQDGFQSFIDCSGDANSSITSPSLVLTGTPLGTFDLNSIGAHFADHIKFNFAGGTGCSAFFGDKNIDATTNLGSNECGGGTSTFESPIPEPSSFLLLGAGLLSLAGLVRRRTHQQ